MHLDSPAPAPPQRYPRAIANVEAPFYKILDAAEAFIIERNLNTDREGQASLSGKANRLLTRALEHLLGDGEPSAYAVFEDDEQVVWILVATGTVAHRIRILEQTRIAVEVESFGSLRGDYTERFEPHEYGEQVQARFVHPKLRVDFVIVPAESARRSRATVARQEQLERLRRILRGWSTAPEISS